MSTKKPKPKTTSRPPASKKSSEPGEQCIVLGHQSQYQSELGFHTQKHPPPRKRGDLVRYSGDGHLITIAPTRAGKGVGTVIPNLLSYQGPVVVIDPKAEAYHVTARRRRELGHQVVRLDPFGVVDEPSDCLNPFDVLRLTGADLESDSQLLAELMATVNQSTKEPFWDIQAKAIHSGLIANASSDTEGRANLNSIVDSLHGDDPSYRMAVLLDVMGKQMNQMAYREIAATIAMPDVTRGGVLATAQSYVKSLMSPAVAGTLSETSFSLQDVVDGKPLSIYLIIPPDRLVSHRPLMKLWIGTLMKAILSRRHRPKLNTLLMIDEAAQLGNFPLLETLMTLAAGYGVWVHTIWQDLSQLRGNYPTTWRTILNNCAVVQTFGIYNRDMATQWGDYLDSGPNVLRSLSDNEQIVSIHGQGELRCRRLNYLTDPIFQGQFDANRFYEPASKKEPKTARSRQKSPDPGRNRAPR
ncbi:type IV secretory system conjugative DNA transfer family protein [Stieleria varia]|uniref:Conjugal transfer protein TraG n=1 Tax=Stieleria varia TaxID=2528005 RepID=A0A5C6AWY9_9BACT|nr:type IV secretory system conjugative DNA transfer family protein [Stieleria varia]TWU04525.1 Conjugal transfer protein TraG [Stieleria varia]